MPQPKTESQAAKSRRKGDSVSALSDFADYVHRQHMQVRRHGAPNNSVASKKTEIEEVVHDELAALDTLDLADSAAAPIRLQALLLGTADAGENAIEQLKDWIKGRVDEGKGEAVLDLGLEENGETMNFSKEDWEHALARFKEAVELYNADCKVLVTKNVEPKTESNGNDDGNGKSTEKKQEVKGCQGKILVRRRTVSINDVIETRIAVVGNVDAGKSTLLGVLVKGGLDDGRGKARVNLFRHKHEIESGRTSSVGMEIMGYDSKGEIVVSSTAGRKLSWEEIGARSAKVISFTDLAGHERYLRTTVFGLLSSEPNYCLLMVAANNGLIGMAREHLGIALALNVPVMVIVTKIDICPPQILQQTISQITKILKSPGARKIPVFVDTMDECVATAGQFVSRRICPIFQVSNVTGQNLDLVRTFLNILPHHGSYDPEAPFEFHINDTFSVPFVGTVVSGVVRSGRVSAGDTVLVGPDSTGQFATTKIRTIERKRIGVQTVSAGQSGSFALRGLKRKDVRKGMVVMHPSGTAPGSAGLVNALAGNSATKDAAPGDPKAYREFMAEVLILSHATTIKAKYQAMLHVGPVSQTCAIIDIFSPSPLAASEKPADTEDTEANGNGLKVEQREYIRTGDRALVAFRFVQRPEFLSIGDRILFREGRTKGLGVVKGLGYDKNNPFANVLMV